MSMTARVTLFLFEVVEDSSAKNRNVDPASPPPSLHQTC